MTTDSHSRARPARALWLSQPLDSTEKTVCRFHSLSQLSAWISLSTLCPSRRASRVSLRGAVAKMTFFCTHYSASLSQNGFVFCAHVDPMSTQCRRNVAPMSTQCRPNVEPMSTQDRRNECGHYVHSMPTQCRRNVASMSTQCRFIVDPMSTQCRRNVDAVLTQCNADSMSTQYRHNVDSMSTQCRPTVSSQINEILSMRDDF